MLSDLGTSSINVPIGKRGPPARKTRQPSREHQDDDVTITRIMPLVTLDSSVKEASDEEISVIPPPTTAQRGRVSLSSLTPFHHPHCPNTTVSTLPSLPVVPLPHTIIPFLSTLSMTAAATGQTPAPKGSPATPPPPLYSPVRTPAPVRFSCTDICLNQSRPPNTSQSIITLSPSPSPPVVHNMYVSPVW